MDNYCERVMLITINFNEMESINVYIRLSFSYFNPKIDEAPLLVTPLV
jgi:hypothetical protein